MATISCVEISVRIEGTSNGEVRICSGINAEVSITTSMINSINQDTDNCTIPILFVKGLNYFFPKFPFEKSINPILRYREFMYFSGVLDREGEGKVGIPGEMAPYWSVPKPHSHPEEFYFAVVVYDERHGIARADVSIFLPLWKTKIG